MSEFTELAREYANAEGQLQGLIDEEKRRERARCTAKDRLDEVASKLVKLVTDDPSVDEQHACDLGNGRMLIAFRSGSVRTCALETVGASRPTYTGPPLPATMKGDGRYVEP